jgi:phospholipid/cholesterol/gamma-HCH transport system substrate-binding protein
MGRHGIAEVLTGAFVLVVALGFMAYAVVHSGRTTGAGYTLYARFDHIDGLSVGNDVRIAGVKVGSVTDETIDLKSFSAIVAMTVRDDIHLPKDSSAEIASESLLGGKYINLSPGGDETDLKAGQTITITQSSISLEQLLGKFIFSVTSLNGSKSSPGNQSGGTPSSEQQGGAGQNGSSPGSPPSGGASPSNGNPQAK